MSHKFLAPLLSLLLAGTVGAAEPSPPAAPVATSTPTPTEGKAAPARPAHIGQVVYQVLVGEFALQRGKPDLAAAAYADLAQRTRDPKVLQRTIDVAMFARQPDLAIAAARLWSEVEPESGRAREVLTSLMASGNRLEEVEPQIARVLAAHPERLAENLMGLNSVFARQTDKQAALRMVERLITPYRNRPEAHYALAEAAQAASDSKLTLAAIREARRLRPEWEAAVIFEARTLAGSEAGAEASRVLDAFVRAYPEAWLARSLYARTLIYEKRYPEALKELKKLAQKSPDDVEVIYPYAILSLQTGEIDVGEKQLQRLLELGFRDQSLVHYFLGQIAEERKQDAEAARHYREVAFGEHYASARTRLSSLLTRQGKNAEARRVLQDSTPHTLEDRAQISIAEARLLRDQKKEQEALEVLQKALKQAPDQPDLLYETALLAERVKRPELGESYLRALVRLQPDHAHALNALGYSLADRNINLPEAHQLISKALQLEPENPFIMDSMGWVLFRQGKAAEGAVMLEKAYKTSTDPEIAAHLGEVWWSLGRKEEATRLWREAARKDQDHEVLGAVMKKFLH